MLHLPSVIIGLRYTRAKDRHQFISFVSGFSLVGMALGTLSLILVLSVMNGFDREIKQRILSVVPHGFVDQKPRMSNWRETMLAVEQNPNVVAAAPYIGEFVMLSGGRSVLGVELQGILPEQESKVSIVAQYMNSGRLDVLQAGDFSIVLGSLVAQYLNVTVGDSVIMTLPQVSITPAGVFPRVKRFQVVGIFEVGAQVDQSLALIHLTDAQRLFRYDQDVQGLRLKAQDIYQAKPMIASLKSKLDDSFHFKDWSQTQGNLFQAIRLEKRMVGLLLMIIIAVAALNIVTSLVLMVSDKRGDIAVLRTLGMTTREVMAIFVVQGSAVGIFGIAIGGILGSLLSVNISDIIRWFEQSVGIYVFDPNVYFISQIPSELHLSDVVIICGVGVVLSLLATLYPAYRAAQIEPAEVLRYE